MLDEQRYAKAQEEKRIEWEKDCKNCGACCGIVEGDPCEHLKKGDKNSYTCAIYENRFGEHKTKSGKVIKCVPIRNILHKSWPGDSKCGYK